MALGARTMPSHADEAARLTSRANEVHQVLDPIAQSRRTTAALGTREGTDILGAGAIRDLSPAQRAALHDGELAAKLPGEHAEVTVMNHANQAGLHPRDIGVSRVICPDCRIAIENSGGRVTGDYTAEWPD